MSNAHDPMPPVQTLKQWRTRRPDFFVKRVYEWSGLKNNTYYDPSTVKRRIKKPSYSTLFHLVQVNSDVALAPLP